MSVSDGLQLSCIVVHFESPATLPATLAALEAAQVLSAKTVVVDNSMSDEASESARAIAESAGCLFLRVDNRGYAAAANSGLQFLTSRGLRTERVLLSTHESLPEPDAVKKLLAAFQSDQAIAVAGPLLFNSGTVGSEIWSAGGRLSRVLKRPRHHTDKLDLQGAPVDRAWLDGAFTLYETAVLEEVKLDESYFLYFEETDLHVRLARLGRRVVVVPGAHASQSSNGIPPRLLGRNLFLFQAKLFSPWRGRLAVGFEAGRSLARKLLTRRGQWRDSASIISGWLEGEKSVRAGARSDESAIARSAH
ncbi:N-acetylglucosaminyl-diphospho-decaprenol L-rhamnosyltransferase [Cryobacterium sp. MP_3.1]|uniref:glycosyltransferase family 2 protein n=1 Tax=Cryobacterium sp. MP_3.1 TaxID=3071711 RepID=UPI002E0770D0|nr:N-acetylglucosaminyl-diphospho-decaprenol L-rhamnosyltransferase [Cryobacterium sp. MP_3.1]